jgi:hypothetical protein
VAERFQALGERAMRLVEKLQDHLEDCLKHPPAMVSTGPMGGFTTTEKRTQLALLFPGETEPEVDDGPPRDRLTLPFARYLRAHQDELLALGAKAAKVALAAGAGIDDGLEEEQETPQASLAELKERSARLNAELHSYSQPEPGEAVA